MRQLLTKNLSMSPKTLSLGFCSLLAAFAAVSVEAKPIATPESRLQAAGVEPTLAGVKKYLESLVSPVVEAEIAKLIEDLGNDQFEVRERATQQLAGMPFPPLGQLEAATKSSDLERALRAKRILALAKDPHASLLIPALAFVEEQKLAVGAPLLITIHGKVPPGPIREAALRALLAIISKDDLAAAKEMLKSSDARVVHAGKWLVSQLERGDGLSLLAGKVDAVTVTPGSVAGGGRDLIQGWEFKVKERLTVMELGVHDHRKSGLKEAHEVAIWDLENKKEPLVQTTIPEGQVAELYGTFRCVSVEPTELLPDRRYAIVAHYSTPADSSVSLINPTGLTIEYAAPIEVIGRRYAFPHKAMAFPSHLGEGARHATFGPTFRFGELGDKK